MNPVYRIQLTSGGNPDHSYTVSSKAQDGSLTTITTSLTYPTFLAGTNISVDVSQVGLVIKSNSPSCASSPPQEYTFPAVSPSPSPSASASPSPTQSPSNTPSASTQSAPPPSGIAVTLYSGDGTSLYFCSSAGTSFQAFVSSSADAAALIDCASTNAVVIYSNDSLSTPYNGNDNYFSPTGTVSQSRCKFRISSAGVVGSRSGACQ